MISDSQIGYGSLCPCHGKLCRPCLACQRKSAAVIVILLMQVGAQFSKLCVSYQPDRLVVAIMQTPPSTVSILAQMQLSLADQQHFELSCAQVESWDQWLNQVELHGLSGLLSQHQSTYQFSIPERITLANKALNLRHKSAAAARYQAMLEISEAFAASDIRYLALKGVALMPYVYGDAAMRPMRDIDLLLPPEQLSMAANVMRELGYALPDSQPSQFMGDMHQLPNAMKIINGFRTSVELHGDGMTREIKDSLPYPRDESSLQMVHWHDLCLPALRDAEMIHQVSRHYEGLHNGALLKLINAVDVVELARKIAAKTNGLEEVKSRFPHVINTLKCLHLLNPLPQDLVEQIEDLPYGDLEGVGQSMVSFRATLYGQGSVVKRLRRLLRPPIWWLHLYYNRDPNKSIYWVLWVKHPLRLFRWCAF